jgi:hypothetical protein
MPAFRSFVPDPSSLGETFLYELKAGPAGGRLRRPSSRRQRHDGHRGAGLTVQRSRHRHRTLIGTLSSPGFGACQRKGPGRCGQQRRDLAGMGGASVSGRQRRLERRLPRRLWRSRWARRFPMAEPACLAISSRKARSGSQRISNRHPASSHHKDRVHTLAPRPTRGIGFNGGTGQRKSAPHARDAPRRWPCFGHTPTSTARTLSIGQAIGQVSWSTAVALPAVAAASGQFGHRRLPPDSPEPPSLSAQAVGWQDASRWSVLGPRSIGPRRSATGTSGHGRRAKSQVT